MSKRKKSEVVGTPQEVPDSPATKPRETKDVIEVISAGLVSLIIPPFDKQIKTINEVEAYTYSVFILHQTNEEGYLRLRLDADIAVHFEKENTIETSAQVVMEFRTLDPLEEGKPFNIDSLPNSTLVAAAHTTYSTARGLLLAKAAGTILQEAVLPIISTSELLAIRPDRRPSHKA